MKPSSPKNTTTVYLGDLFDESDDVLHVRFDQLDFRISHVAVALQTLNDSLVTLQNTFAKFVQIVDQIVVGLVKAGRELHVRDEHLDSYREKKRNKSYLIAYH